MKYVILSIIFIFLLLLLLFYPFRISIYNEDNYLLINVSKFLTLRLNLFVLLDKANGQKIKKQTKGIKAIKKIKFKEITLRIQGLNWEYRLNGAYFGIIYALFGFVRKICEANEIDFNYDLKYQGDKSIEFKTIVRASLSKVLIGFSNI